MNLTCCCFSSLSLFHCHSLWKLYRWSSWSLNNWNSDYCLERELRGVSYGPTLLSVWIRDEFIFCLSVLENIFPQELCLGGWLQRCTCLCCSFGIYMSSVCLLAIMYCFSLYFRGEIRPYLSRCPVGCVCMFSWFQTTLFFTNLRPLFLFSLSFFKFQHFGDVWRKK